MFFIALQDGEPIGYIGIYTCIDEGYIANIAVAKQYRNRGVATRLIDRVICLGREKKLKFISLEVRASNKKALSLYEKFDFSKEGLRKNYYVDPTEDALIMTRRF